MRPVPRRILVVEVRAVHLALVAHQCVIQQMWHSSFDRLVLQSCLQGRQRVDLTRKDRSRPFEGEGAVRAYEEDLFVLQEPSVALALEGEVVVEFYADLKERLAENGLEILPLAAGLQSSYWPMVQV